MSKREASLALIVTLGAVLLLSASPAAALFCALCDCDDSCTKACINGPEIPDCPECNDSTCGVDGPLCAGQPECGTCAAVSCTSTVNGTNNGDTLNGGGGDECINGLGGNDTIHGNAGGDRIHGGDGNDTVYGDSGDDCLWGDAGTDNAQGDTGTDFCDAEFEVGCEL